MGKASKTLYIIGRIINILEIVLCGILVLIGLLGLGSAKLAEDAEKAAEFRIAAITLITIGIIYVIISVVTIILATKAINAVEDGKVNRRPHITIIVVGAISSNPLYVVGGILGIISESREVKKEEAN